MVGLVHGQHADCECAYPPWHPPAQTSDCAILTHREGVAVLQNMGGQIAGCGDPGPSNDREAHLDQGTSCSQHPEPCGRIAQILLATEIKPQHAVCPLAPT